MAAWNDYKQHVRNTDPEIGKDPDKIEAVSQIVGMMIEQHHDLYRSQRNLAGLCNLPHASAAGIESGTTAPNLSTFLKIAGASGQSLIAAPDASPVQRR